MLKYLKKKTLKEKAVELYKDALDVDRKGVYVGVTVAPDWCPNKRYVVVEVEKGIPVCTIVNVDDNKDIMTLASCHLIVVDSFNKNYYKEKEEKEMENNNHKFVAGDYLKIKEGGFAGVIEAPRFYSLNRNGFKVEHVDNFGVWTLTNEGGMICLDGDELQFAFKNGDEVEVSFDNKKWERRDFVGINPVNGAIGRYIAVTEDGISIGWKYIRPIKPKQTTIPIMIGGEKSEISIESAKALRDVLSKELKEVE